MENLKDYREKELRNYFIGNILIMLFSYKQFNETFFQISLTNIENDNNLITIFITFLSSTFVSSIIYIYLFIFDSLISTNFKSKLCNLGGKLPGETIFEKIRYKNIDKRFTKDLANIKYQEIYSKLDRLKGKEKSQCSNAFWYAIYKSHQEEAMIQVANRDYLLCRDMCFSTLSLSFIYLILVCLRFSFFSEKYLFFLVVELIFTNIAMRNKAKRLTFNVIATDIHDGEK